MAKIKKTEITKGNLWQIEHKTFSLQNKTKLSDKDCKIVVDFIMHKYNINKLEALNYLIDCFFDGEIILSKQNEHKNPNTVKLNCKILNLEDL